MGGFRWGQTLEFPSLQVLRERTEPTSVQSTEPKIIQLLPFVKSQKFWCFFVQHLFFQKKSSKSKVGTKGHLWKTGYFEDISFMDIWATNPRFSSLTTSSCPNNDPMGTTRWGFFFKGRVGRFMVGAHLSVFTGGRV